MAKSKPIRRADGWFDKRTIAAMFGCSVKHFDQHLRRLLRDDSERTCPTNQRKLEFYAPDLIEAWTEYTCSQRLPMVAEGDPMMVGPSSPALERYRDEKARTERIKRLELEKEIINVQVMRPILQAGISLFQNFVQQLESEDDEEMAERVRDLMDDWGASLGEIAPDDASEDQSTQGSARKPSRKKRRSARSVVHRKSGASKAPKSKAVRRG